MMDQQQLFLSEENDGNGKPPELPGEGQQARVRNTQEAKARPTFDTAVQTQAEEKKVPSVMVQVQQKQQGERGKVQCVTVSVQQQWDGRGEVPELTVQVQQGQHMPSVTVEVQQEWNRTGGVSCVSVKVQQQTVRREIPHRGVQQNDPGGEIPCEDAHWLPTNRYKDALHAKQDQQQSQCKDGIIIGEKEQQQDQEETNLMDSKSLWQGMNQSVGNESLQPQCSWDPSTEQLKPEDLLQREQKESRLEVVLMEKKLHEDSQCAEPTNMFNLHPFSMREEDSQDPATEQQQEHENEDDISSHQQPCGSDEGTQKVNVEEKEHEHEEKNVSKKPRRDMPNYFVAIPIANDQILDKIEDVQELIFTKEPDLLKALIPVQTMHLTIIVAHLRTEDDVKRAVSALEHSKAKVQALLQGKLFSMTFRGIGQFNNQVIYIKMSEDEQQMLSRIVEAVASSFTRMNVDIRGSKDFRPHLTILKLSKSRALRCMGFTKVEEDLYTEYEDSPFGTEILRQIDLCAMHEKQASGYYHCVSSINVCPTIPEDHKNKKQLADAPKENLLDIPLKGGTCDNTRTKPGEDDLAAQRDGKVAGNLDGDASTSEETGLNKIDAETRAKHKTFSADREVCSKSVPEFLPALKAKD